MTRREIKTALRVLGNQALKKILPSILKTIRNSGSDTPQLKSKTMQDFKNALRNVRTIVKGTSNGFSISMRIGDKKDLAIFNKSGSSGIINIFDIYDESKAGSYNITPRNTNYLKFEWVGFNPTNASLKWIPIKYGFISKENNKWYVFTTLVHRVKFVGFNISSQEKKLQKTIISFFEEGLAEIFAKETVKKLKKVKSLKRKW